MTLYFVSRHPGAVEWAARRGIAVDRLVRHLDITALAPSDVIVGSLPIHLAAEVCCRGVRLLCLTVNLPSERRGTELSADDLERYGARIQEFRVVRVEEDPGSCEEMGTDKRRPCR